MFVGAAAALIASPGPGQALVIARAVTLGLRAGVLTSLGLNAGTLVHTLVAATGLSAIFASSVLAFTVVKVIGAVWLLVLGLKGLMAKPGEEAAAGPEAPRTRSLFVHAFATGVFNPKVALFFMAFLPQFVDVARGAVLLQFLILGGIVVVLGILGDAFVAFLASVLHRRLSRETGFGLWRERLMGAVLVALALRLIFVSRDAAH
jgi:threonine/homoserine/homoserine lactone efflux protein